MMKTESVEREKLRKGFDEVHVLADTTAQIFWLKNRMSERWRDKQEHSINANLRQEHKLTDLIEELKDDDS